MLVLVQKKENELDTSYHVIIPFVFSAFSIFARIFTLIAKWTSHIKRQIYSFIIKAFTTKVLPLL